IKLPNLFKWKVAFLYSNQRLIPVYKHDVLIRIAKHYGLNTNKKTPISKIQNIMMENKPMELNVFEFMWSLFEKFGDDKDKAEVGKVYNKQKEGRKRIRRVGTNDKNIDDQIRSFADCMYIANQKHNKLQLTLKEKLVAKFGEENVIMEENNVDIKLSQSNYLVFYEIKSSSYASGCIREALGQILSYAFNDKDERDKKLVVVGQFPPNKSDLAYINFIKGSINFDFEYEYIELESVV